MRCAFERCGVFQRTDSRVGIVRISVNLLLAIHTYTHTHNIHCIDVLNRKSVINSPRIGSIDMRVRVDIYSRNYRFFHWSHNEVSCLAFFNLNMLNCEKRRGSSEPSVLIK